MRARSRCQSSKVRKAVLLSKESSGGLSSWYTSISSGFILTLARMCAQLTSGSSLPGQQTEPNRLQAKAPLSVRPTCSMHSNQAGWGEVSIQQDMFEILTRRVEFERPSKSVAYASLTSHFSGEPINRPVVSLTCRTPYCMVFNLFQTSLIKVCPYCSRSVEFAYDYELERFIKFHRQASTVKVKFVNNEICFFNCAFTFKFHEKDIVNYLLEQIEQAVPQELLACNKAGPNLLRAAAIQSSCGNTQPNHLLWSRVVCPFNCTVRMVVFRGVIESLGFINKRQKPVSFNYATSMIQMKNGRLLILTNDEDERGSFDKVIVYETNLYNREQRATQSNRHFLLLDVVTFVKGSLSSLKGWTAFGAGSLLDQDKSLVLLAGGYHKHRRDNMMAKIKCVISEMDSKRLSCEIGDFQQYVRLCPSIQIRGGEALIVGNQIGRVHTKSTHQPQFLSLACPVLDFQYEKAEREQAPTYLLQGQYPVYVTVPAADTTISSVWFSLLLQGNDFVDARNKCEESTKVYALTKSNQPVQIGELGYRRSFRTKYECEYDQFMRYALTNNYGDFSAEYNPSSLLLAFYNRTPTDDSMFVLETRRVVSGRIAKAKLQLINCN